MFFLISGSTYMCFNKKKIPTKYCALWVDPPPPQENFLGTPLPLYNMNFFFNISYQAFVLLAPRENVIKQ